MAIYIAAQALFDGLDTIPYLYPLLRTLPWLFLLWLAKTYLQGARNLSERNMHGKVIIITGGTSGIGEATVRALATRGAQIVLLTQHALSDPFTVDFVEDMRHETGNELITAEQVDLRSLWSVRKFATRWVDNAPPRRLDMLVLCGSTLTPRGKGVESTVEGVEVNWQVNYLANFHLLSILSPALRAQPPDRDVRVVFGTCGSYLGGDLGDVLEQGGKKKEFSPGTAYATSKLALTTFALAFQKHLDAYKRPDNNPMAAKVVLVDPGLCRTPGTRRWLGFGSLIGLLLYLVTYPLWLLVLKAPEMGAQSFLYALMEEKFARGEGGVLVKECKERDYLRKDVQDEVVQKKLWAYSEQMVQEAEKRGATVRTKAKKEEEERKDEEEAVRQMQDYKEKVGKKDGQKEGSRKSKKAG